MEDDESLFAEAMGKVKPLTPDNKVIANKPKPRPSRIKQPQNLPPVSLSSQQRSLKSGDEPWVLVADGISRERLKRLASEAPARTLDLHGYTRDEAMSQLETLFAEAIHNGVRILAIIHGRGLHSEGKAVLKDAVYQWLQCGPCADAVLAAIPQPGSGGGSCLVLLRRGQSL